MGVAWCVQPDAEKREHTVHEHICHLSPWARRASSPFVPLVRAGGIRTHSSLDAKRSTTVLGRCSATFEFCGRRGRAAVCTVLEQVGDCLDLCRWCVCVCGGGGVCVCRGGGLNSAPS